MERKNIRLFRIWCGRLAALLICVALLASLYVCYYFIGADRAYGFSPFTFLVVIVAFFCLTALFHIWAISKPDWLADWGSFKSLALWTGLAVAFAWFFNSSLYNSAGQITLVARHDGSTTYALFAWFYSVVLCALLATFGFELKLNNTPKGSR